MVNDYFLNIGTSEFIKIHRCWIRPNRRLRCQDQGYCGILNYDTHCAYFVLKGIQVSNTPGAVDDGTATTALYLLIATVRQYTRAELSARARTWKNGLKPAHDPSALTLGILGLGGIGLRFAKMCHALPMKKIMYHNRKPVEGAPEWLEYYPKGRLAEMLHQTDVLSVHVPLKSDTEGLVDEKMIRTLKKGAIIINTARGKVIDEDALIRALEDGQARLSIE